MPVVLSRSDHPVASVLHTEEVTGSNLVSPTKIMCLLMLRPGRSSS
jgi:hypothetical protein